MADPRDTPAMRQYAGFKRRHQGCVLLFRMGDFYEMFDDDAVAVSKAIGLTLTQRTAGVPMAGVPFHQLDNYLRKLLAAGFRVAVCDQVQDPKDAKGLVERAVTRVVTPGTLVDEPLLSDESVSRVAAAHQPAGWAEVGLAVADLSTGEFVVCGLPLTGLADELARQGVTELIGAEGDDTIGATITAAAMRAGASVTPRPAWGFRGDDAAALLREQFGVATLAGFGLTDDDPAVPAAGALVRYLRETQSPAAAAGGPPPLAHLRPPRREPLAGRCVIDAAGLRALEVDRTLRSASHGGSLEGSLVGLFTGCGSRPVSCRTAMGKRRVGDWLRRPSGSRATIESRHARVAALADDRRLAGQVAGLLDGVQDVARIAARVALGRAGPRDLVALSESAGRAAGLAAALEGVAPLAELRAAFSDAGGAVGPVAAAIAARCVDRPPAHLREGGLIRDGVDPELDEARVLRRDAGEWLAAYQRRLAVEHGLPSLRVGYNRVFGYYIELPAAQARAAPQLFSRKQTLKNAERFITPELRDFEHKVTTAEARAIDRERAIFDELCSMAVAVISPLSSFADAAGELDALACFAERAVRSRWVRPAMTDGPVLEVRAGRHPVLDDLLGDRFVPNDLSLGADDGPRLAVITGPNMAGKSTFIRQAALITLLAHAGSFVPAESAVIGVTDRIFTRVGADDALHAGQSTFMVEMAETAVILNHATDRSLVILDEVGRGTGTLDGLSLAWAIAEHLAGSPGPGRARGPAGAARPRTLFATHYHELTRLATDRPRAAVNLHVVVREWPAGSDHAEIVFLHRIAPGGTDRSYGVHVARLAGVPAGVVARAREMLDTLSVRSDRPEHPAKDRAPQLDLFEAAGPHPAVVELSGLNLDAMSPMQAFDALRRLKGLAEGSGHRS